MGYHECADREAPAVLPVRAFRTVMALAADHVTRRAAVRDIPASCTCRWRWDAPGRRWARAEPRESCPWHLWHSLGLPDAPHAGT
jgi:hypothetical protein